MTEIFRSSLTNIDKEKGLEISYGASLLPSTDPNLKVKDASSGEVLEFQYVVSDRGTTPIIRGSNWRKFIRSYQVGAIITLYTYEGPDASYKIEVR